MELVSLNDVVKNMYDARVSFIREKNIELEREYFTEKSSSLPLGEIVKGTSYEELFESCKETVRTASKNDLDTSFMMLREYFLFSYGHDYMFRKKLEADIFNSVPIDELIYPMLLKDIKSSYNDISVMRENPNLKQNLETIDKKIYTYTELQSLLFLLYWNDFMFPDNWEGLVPDTYQDIIVILEKSGMTIGDFLHALIDYKCNIMKDIFNEIENSQLKNEYLKQVEDLRGEKHEETNSFTHLKLPIIYFLNHTFNDFLEWDRDSSIKENNESNGNKKIVLS